MAHLESVQVLCCYVSIQGFLDLLPVLNSIFILVTIWPSFVDPCNVLVRWIMAKFTLGGVPLHVGLQ